MSLVAAATMGMFGIRFVGYYAAVLVALAVGGYAGTLLFARPASAQSTISMRSNTSPAVSLAITAPVASLYALSAPTRIFPIVVVVGFALSVAALFQIHQRFARISTRTYAALGQ